ncbi:MAG: hypothetical protein ACP5JW_00525 [Candidatus Bathyarchaeia archaeon]
MADAPTRLKAKIAGVNKTPTLVFKGQKLWGLDAIKTAVEKKLEVY